MWVHPFVYDAYMHCVCMLECVYVCACLAMRRTNSHACNQTLNTNPDRQRMQPPIN